jgi:hypothetical protein
MALFPSVNDEIHTLLQDSPHGERLSDALEVSLITTLAQRSSVGWDGVGGRGDH